MKWQVFMGIFACLLLTGGQSNWPIILLSPQIGIEDIASVICKPTNDAHDSVTGTKATIAHM